MDELLHHDAIIRERIVGKSVRAIAQDHGCSIAEVNKALDLFAVATINAKVRFRCEYAAKCVDGPCGLLRLIKPEELILRPALSIHSVHTTLTAPVSMATNFEP